MFVCMYLFCIFFSLLCFSLSCFQQFTLCISVSIFRDFFRVLFIFFAFICILHNLHQFKFNIYICFFVFVLFFQLCFALCLLTSKRIICQFKEHTDCTHLFNDKMTNIMMFHVYLIICFIRNFIFYFLSLNISLSLSLRFSIFFSLSLFNSLYFSFCLLFGWIFILFSAFCFKFLN